MSMYGALDPSPPRSLFGGANSTAAGSGGGLFGATNPHPSGGGMFGSTSQPGQQSSIFGNPGSSSAGQGGSTFGATTQAGGGGSLFPPTTSAGGGGSIFGSMSRPDGGSIFGSTTQAGGGGGIFGPTSQAGGSGGSIFGATTQAGGGGAGGGSLFPPTTSASGGVRRPGLFETTSIFAPATTQAQTGGNPFGASANPPAGSSLFGSQPPQAAPSGSSFMGDQSRIWSAHDPAARQKSVPEQLQIIQAKWNPDAATTPFRTYLYNQVDPAQAPFYRPGQYDNEEKWEEALAAAPTPGSIPVLVRGFFELGKRMLMQRHLLLILQGRLVEIERGLDALMTRHDTEISIRAQAARVRHVRQAQSCLALATKVQVLRNRGYAMDGPEEELRAKLLELEKRVFDPTLGGRGEEIWARMVHVRERGRQLRTEFDRLGRSVEEGSTEAIPDEWLKRAKRVLEDYDKQIGQLSKEVDTITAEYEGWEKSGPAANDIRRR